MLVSVVLVYAGPVRAAPQAYGVLKVQEPQARAEQLGPYENLVDVIVESLPEITEAFQKITNARNSSSDPGDISFIEEMVLSFLPFTEKLFKATAKAEGREASPEELARMSRVSEVLPGYFRLLEDMIKRDSEGQSGPASVESGSSDAAGVGSASPATGG